MQISEKNSLKISSIKVLVRIRVTHVSHEKNCASICSVILWNTSSVD